MKFKAKITRMVDGNSKIKAIADVSFEGGFRVTGIKVCQGSKGLFLGMPSNSYTNSDGEKKYTDILLIVLGSLLLITAIMIVLDTTGVGRDFDWRLLSI